MNKIILKSSITEDGIGRIVLHSQNGELVTHFENVQVGGYAYGNYYSKGEMVDAIRNFLDRCKRYKVVPILD